MFEELIKIAQKLNDNQSAGTVALALTPEKIKSLESTLFFWLGAGQLVLMGLTFGICIFISHRIAGPLFKLRRSMLEVSNGKLDRHIAFRKNDYFPELQDAFNEMIDGIRDRKKP